MTKQNELKKYFRENSLQITMQVFTVAVTILNLWIATKLAPVTQDLAVLTTRVEANERLDITQASMTDIQAINQRLGRIENNLDTYVFKIK